MGELTDAEKLKHMETLERLAWEQCEWARRERDELESERDRLRRQVEEQLDELALRHQTIVVLMGEIRELEHQRDELRRKRGERTLVDSRAEYGTEAE